MNILGIVVGTLFHLFAHDEKGPLGATLRSVVYSVIDPAALGLGDMDDRMFAVFAMNLFMQITGIIMLPYFMGPSFSPIAAPWVWLLETIERSTASNVSNGSDASKAAVAVKSRRKRKKKTS